MESRIAVIKSIRYVNQVIPYTTEKNLVQVLKNLLKKHMIDVRFLGEDWRGKKFTGWELSIPVKFNPRKHLYSSTHMRKMIYNKLLKEKITNKKYEI